MSNYSSFLDMSHRENKDRRTLYCGNLHENVTEELLFELFLQVDLFDFLLI
jgi:RNA recognition motif-containing protein